jgi:hypothetical protein
MVDRAARRLHDRQQAAAHVGEGGWRANGALIAASALFDVQAALAQAGVGPVVAVSPDYVFEADSQTAAALATQLGFGV